MNCSCKHSEECGEEQKIKDALANLHFFVENVLVGMAVIEDLLMEKFGVTEDEINERREDYIKKLEMEIGGTDEDNVKR